MADKPKAAAPRPFSLLLVEPYFVLRRTVASVARGLEGITVHEAPSLDMASELFNNRPFDGFVLAMSEVQPTLDVIKSIRAGSTPSVAKASVAVTAEHCDIATITALRELGVQRIMLKPFKVKTVLETVEGFSPRHPNA